MNDEHGKILESTDVKQLKKFLQMAKEYSNTSNYELLRDAGYFDEGPLRLDYNCTNGAVWGKDKTMAAALIPVVREKFKEVIPQLEQSIQNLSKPQSPKP